MNNSLNNFKTQVDLDLYLDRTDNYEVETKNMNLSWNLELEVRNYGVKSFVITVPDQQVVLSLRVWGDEEDTYENMTLDIKDVQVELSDNSGMIVPQSIEFFKGKWKLVF